jgi:hypothetical protein
MPMIALVLGAQAVSSSLHLFGRKADQRLDLSDLNESARASPGSCDQRVSRLFTCGDGALIRSNVVAFASVMSPEMGIAVFADCCYK